MVVDGLLKFLLSILEPMTGALPQARLPEGFDAYMYNVAAELSRLDYFLPFLGPINALVSAMAVAATPLLTFAVGLFVYRRVRG